jgi:tetratricopeptide repeat protein 30
VAPAVLANLAVCYVLAARNEDAEELMARLEAEEEEAAAAAAAAALAPATLAPALALAPPQHLCIVNLAIGTLYCTKHNFDFGVTRVLRALEPVPAKLSPDTWCYAKRCLLALAEAAAKHAAAPRDDLVDAIIACCAAVERAGEDMPADGGGGGGGGGGGDANAGADAGGQLGAERTVAAEARVLRRIYLLLAEG